MREHQAGRAGLQAGRRQACGDAPRRRRTQCVAAAAGQTDRPPCPASCSAQGDRAASDERGWLAGPWAARGAAPPRAPGLPTRPSARHKPRGHDWLLGGEDEAAVAAAVGGAGHCRCRLPPGHRGRPAQGLGRAAPAAAHAARLHGRAGCSARHPSSRCLLLAGLGGMRGRAGRWRQRGATACKADGPPSSRPPACSSSPTMLGAPKPSSAPPLSSLFPSSDRGPRPALSAPQLSLPTSSVACRPPAPAPPRLRSCTAAPRGGRGAATRTGRLGRRRQPAAAAACPTSLACCSCLTSCRPAGGLSERHHTLSTHCPKLSAFACSTVPQPRSRQGAAMEHQLSTSALAKLAKDLKELQAQPIDGVKVRR